MIANKHTEMRIFSNLNDLIENGLSKQELTQKIHRYTYDYLMEYIDIQRTEEGRELFDIFEELGDYHLHTLEIAKRIRDNILGSIDYLDPKIYTKEYKSDLLEDIENKVVDNYFKELNNVINNFEYIKKIDNLRRKERKNIVEENKDDIKFLINARINKAYEFYLNKANGNAKLVIDNFSLVQEIIDDVFDDVLSSIHEGVDESITKSDIESMFIKQLKAFVKEQKALITPEEHQEQPPTVIVQEKNVKIPKSVIAYGIAKIWEDITK